MSTVDKDFKVKNGIQVAGNAVVGGTITASDPTAVAHVATKGYVDLIALPTVDSTAPETPQAGKLWLDTVSARLHVFDGTSWIALATKEDASVLQDHIHDTAIDGTGRIVSVFVDAGDPNSTFMYSVSAGLAEDTEWEILWDGGVATDNFN